MIIYILWLRQLKRYFRSKARIVGSLGQPVLFLLALGYGFGPIFPRAGGGNYIQFLAPGIIAMGILFTALFSGIEIIWDRQFGFLKEMLVAPVSRVEIMIGRTLGGATVAVIQGILIFIISMFAGLKIPTIQHGLFSLVFMALLALLFTALGTMIASLLEDMQGFQLIMNFMVLPLFFLSGALFPLKGTSTTLETIAKIDPLSYGIDGIRGTLGQASNYGLMTDTIVLAVITLVFLAIGSYLFSKIQI
jgi:ABC-2 type transport system permease protein